ncbi:MAG: 2Fe-2S iron-sulfur cluster-binding protein [Candidatus Izemoplasmatales bacterium]|jgi:carbon-monoxide dehydrogenase small subunit|nr:2Fe-2S iron-sulfur cluster-binding protein [bacterium]MDZ4195862.1 2Fe-2S iron-sulfur cluster-binding protein [Candidatus Izemoplasmatales bacterium]
MKVELYLNQKKQVFDVLPGEYLLDTLRRYDILSVKRGCEQTSCGVCSVLLDSDMIPSCSVLTVRLQGRHITTVEGIEEEATKIAFYFGQEGADQCGFCNPAMALAVYSLKRKNPHATDQEIKEYLVGNLCRCTGYQSQHLAIKRYLEDPS